MRLILCGDHDRYINMFSVKMKESCVVSENRLQFFKDGEFSVSVDPFKNQEDCIILISLRDSFPQRDALKELLFTYDAVKRAGASAIHLICPYLAYARQDRSIIDEAGGISCISVAVILKQIRRLDFSSVMFFDVHCPGYLAIFETRMKHLECGEIFKDNVMHQLEGLGKDKCVLVAPDAGALKKIRALKGVIKDDRVSREVVFMDKVRSAPSESHISCVVGDVKGKTCMIFDDIADSAGTLVNSINALKNSGADRVFAFISHAVLSGEAEGKILNSSADCVFFSDSIPRDFATARQKIKVVSLASFVETRVNEINEK